jgi:hypothetical protein
MEASDLLAFEIEQLYALRSLSQELSRRRDTLQQAQESYDACHSERELYLRGLATRKEDAL